MIKDIVVNLNVGVGANWASDYAISVAAAFNAHLTGRISLRSVRANFGAGASISDPDGAFQCLT